MTTKMPFIDADGTIYINRGNKLVIEYSIENDESDYVFKEGDVVSFGIYKEKGMDEEPVLYKEFKATAGETTIDISITAKEMKIGDYINKEVKYWYEIELNDEETTTGFDYEDGAKILWLYPEGKKIDVSSQE